MATGNDGVLKCPKRDGTELKKDKIDTLPLNKVVRDLVQMLGKLSLTASYYIKLIQ
jgi:hypothetical protein